MKNIMLLILMMAIIGCGVDRDSLETTAELQQELVTDVTRSVDVPSTVSADITASECENSPGPYITLNGELTLGGFGARLIFRNNKKGTHEYTDEFITDILVLNAGESIVLPKQPVLGGVGGNPHILVQLVDGDDQPLGDEVYLGRCVQGLDSVDSLFGAPGLADAFLTELSCSNNPGPFINVDGSLVMDGVKVRVIFRNNLQGTHETDVVKDLTVLEPGITFEFPKQPPLGGVGGNPLIWMQFVDGDGNDLSEEIFLGRCNQLSKKL